MFPVNFSCQFVVRSRGDYSVHLVDPDVIVDWNEIEQLVGSVK